MVSCMTRHPNNQSLHFYKGGINTVEITNRLMKNREKFQKWLEPFIHRLEKYIQQYKAKYRRNGLLYCFLVISLAGYVFFSVQMLGYRILRQSQKANWESPSPLVRGSQSSRNAGSIPRNRRKWKSKWKSSM